MKAFILRDRTGKLWGINSSYNNAVLFLDAGSGMQAWQNLGSSANPYELVEVDITDSVKLIKVFDDDKTMKLETKDGTIVPQENKPS
jgi:hypothetical protein